MSLDIPPIPDVIDTHALPSVPDPSSVLGAFHEMVLDSMSEGVSVSTEDGIIIYTNPAEDAMFGYARGALVGMHVTALNAYQAGENDRIVSGVMDTLRQHGVWEGEWHNRNKEGATFFTHSRITALRHNGQLFWVCVQRDITVQKREREELAAARQYLSLILASVAEYVISYDSQGRVIFVSARAAEFVGLPAEAIMGKTHQELFPEYVGSAYSKALESTFQTQQKTTVLSFYEKTRQWFENHLFPSQAGVTVLATNITEKKQLEARAAETEARMSLALKAGRMGGWHWDLRTGQGHWLHGMAELHGLPESVRSLPMAEYLEHVHPEDRESLAKVVESALARNEDYRCEYRIVWPDKSIHWLESQAVLFIGEGGEVEKIAGVCIDVTERLRKERDLAFLAQASAELAEFVDRQGTLDKVAQLAVPGFADWCAVDLLAAPDILSRVAVAHIDPEKVALAHELQKRFPPDKKSPNGAWEAVRTGKSIFVPLITEEMFEVADIDPEYKRILRSLGLTSYICAPLMAHGRCLGVLTFVAAESMRSYTLEDLAMAEDLARRAAIAIENAELYSTLKESDRRKDVFLATLAHELRNPLAPIINGLEIIKLAPEDTRRIMSSARLMERQAQQLARLVDDLLDISRITAGKIVLQKERTTLANVINAAVETSQPHVQAARHNLSISLPGVPTDIVCDPVRLAQVFSNLINNAARYTLPGGQLHVEVEATPEEYIVRVRDNGIGIPADMLTKVFDMFTQVEHPIDRRHGGLGIGLSLVQGLVSLHGGTVLARSDGEGKGSEFAVHLPRASGNDLTSPGPVSSSPTEGAQKEALRILLVDDNVDAATTTAQILEILGHQVSAVHTGQSAIEAFERLSPDVILLDLGLPDMSGYDVARRIRECTVQAQPLLIALTGWGQDRDKASTAQAGFDDHMVKPVSISELMSTITKKRKAR